MEPGTKQEGSTKHAERPVFPHQTNTTMFTTPCLSIPQHYFRCFPCKTPSPFRVSPLFNPYIYHALVTTERPSHAPSSQISPSNPIGHHEHPYPQPRRHRPSAPSRHGSRLPIRTPPRRRSADISADRQSLGLGHVARRTPRDPERHARSSDRRRR